MDGQIDMTESGGMDGQIDRTESGGMDGQIDRTVRGNGRTDRHDSQGEWTGR